MTLVLSVQTSDKFTEAVAESAVRHEGQYFKSIDYDPMTDIVTVAENPEFTGSPEVHILTPYMVHRAIERIVTHDTEDTVVGQLQFVITKRARENSYARMQPPVGDAILQVACWGTRRY